ncbi:hypothetical protein BDR04DRAFT_1096422 [Suillus decipiens]|nr:hypothetical protein BDR04DRAFT_1096422 [Suillus decipiens]
MTHGGLVWLIDNPKLMLSWRWSHTYNSRPQRRSAGSDNCCDRICGHDTEVIY